MCVDGSFWQFQGRVGLFLGFWDIGLFHKGSYYDFLIHIETPKINKSKWVFLLSNLKWSKGHLKFVTFHQYPKLDKKRTAFCLCRKLGLQQTGTRLWPSSCLRTITQAMPPPSWFGELSQSTVWEVSSMNPGKVLQTDWSCFRLWWMRSGGHWKWLWR